MQKHLNKLKMIEVIIGEQLMFTIVNDAAGDLINSKLCDSSLLSFKFSFFLNFFVNVNRL